MSEIKFTTNPIDKKKSTKGAGKIVVIAVIVFVALVIVFNCFAIVNEGFIYKNFLILNYRLYHTARSCTAYCQTY